MIWLKSIEHNGLRFLKVNNAKLAQLGIHQSGSQEVPGQSPLKVHFFPYFIPPPRNPLLSTLYNYGKTLNEYEIYAIFRMISQSNYKRQ